MYTLGPVKSKEESSYSNIYKVYLIDQCFVYNKNGTYVGTLERFSENDGWLLYDVTFHCQASFNTIDEARDMLNETECENLSEFHKYFEKYQEEKRKWEQYEEDIFGKPPWR